MGRRKSPAAPPIFIMAGQGSANENQEKRFLLVSRPKQTNFATALFHAWRWQHSRPFRLSLRLPVAVPAIVNHHNYETKQRHSNIFIVDCTDHHR
jgi:hypothetical protein